MRSYCLGIIGFIYYYCSPNETGPQVGYYYIQEVARQDERIFP